MVQQEKSHVNKILFAITTLDLMLIILLL